MGRISIRDLIRTVEVPDEIEAYVLELRQEAKGSTKLLHRARKLLRSQALVEYQLTRKPAQDIIDFLDTVDAHLGPDEDGR